MWVLSISRSFSLVLKLSVLLGYLWLLFFFMWLRWDKLWFLVILLKILPVILSCYLFKTSFIVAFFCCYVPTFGWIKTIFGNWKPFKNSGQCFFFQLKSCFSFLKCLNIFPDSFGHAGKRFDQNTKVNFKIGKVIKRKTKKYNNYIVQYLKK